MHLELLHTKNKLDRNLDDKPSEELVYNSTHHSTESHEHQKDGMHFLFFPHKS